MDVMGVGITQIQWKVYLHVIGLKGAYTQQIKSALKWNLEVLHKWEIIGAF